jgi:hypothetical protein
MEVSQDRKSLNLKLSFSGKRGRNGEKDLGVSGSQTQRCEERNEGFFDLLLYCMVHVFGNPICNILYTFQLYAT